MESKQLPFTGFKHYYIYEDGLIFDRKMGRYVSSAPLHKYTLYGIGKPKRTWDTKCLVWFMFVGRIPIGKYPDFIIPNTGNYHPSNLELKSFHMWLKFYKSDDDRLFYEKIKKNKHAEEAKEKMREAKRKKVTAISVFTGESVAFESIEDMLKKTNLTRRTFNRRLKSQEPLNGWIFKTESRRELTRLSNFDPRPKTT